MKLLVFSVCLALLSLFTALMLPPTLIAARSGLKATTIATGNGLGLIGTTGTGSGAIITAMANGFRGTVANFISDL